MLFRARSASHRPSLMAGSSLEELPARRQARPQASRGPVDSRVRCLPRFTLFVRTIELNQPGVFVHGLDRLLEHLEGFFIFIRREQSRAYRGEESGERTECVV